MHDHNNNIPASAGANEFPHLLDLDLEHETATRKIPELEQKLTTLKFETETREDKLKSEIKRLEGSLLRLEKVSITGEGVEARIHAAVADSLPEYWSTHGLKASESHEDDVEKAFAASKQQMIEADEGSLTGDWISEPTTDAEGVSHAEAWGSETNPEEAASKPDEKISATPPDAHNAEIDSLKTALQALEASTAKAKADRQTREGELTRELRAARAEAVHREHALHRELAERRQREDKLEVALRKAEAVARASEEMLASELGRAKAEGRARRERVGRLQPLAWSLLSLLEGANELVQALDLGMEVEVEAAERGLG